MRQGFILYSRGWIHYAAFWDFRQERFSFWRAPRLSGGGGGGGGSYYDHNSLQYGGYRLIPKVIQGVFCKDGDFVEEEA